MALSFFDQFDFVNFLFGKKKNNHFYTTLFFFVRAKKLCGASLHRLPTAFVGIPMLHLNRDLYLIPLGNFTHVICKKHQTAWIDNPVHFNKRAQIYFVGINQGFWVFAT